jgi:two-component system, NarL family, nitrate/nitrite response regulator NarL
MNTSVIKIYAADDDAAGGSIHELYTAPEPDAPQTTIVIGTQMRLYREALAGVLERHAGFEVLQGVTNADELHEVIARLRVDVALVDLEMLGTPAEVASLRRNAPDLRIVALAATEDVTLALTCVEIGLAGWVARDATLDDLLGAVQAAARGELRCTPRTAAALARRLEVLCAQNEPAPPAPGLTAREWQILGLIEEGLSNKEIAARLCIALPTVKNHIHHLLDKLGARGRVEAVAVGRRSRRAGTGPSLHAEPVPMALTAAPDRFTQ